MISVISLDLSEIRALYFSDYRASIKYKTKFIDNDEEEFKKWLYSAIDSYQIINIDIFIAYLGVYQGWLHTHDNAYKELYAILFEKFESIDIWHDEVVEVTDVQIHGENLLTIMVEQ